MAELFETEKECAEFLISKYKKANDQCTATIKANIERIHTLTDFILELDNE